ncbi:hypothetical protein TESG_08284 [Trichophyton tonsurans CBS 112818]|uniref:Uncharacterized protein n=1 Tax=Trichophyton tonsurans (strain CBS 112818) TaxID=647933 RepID=F2RQF3_TRIT1|nr:hypothetical protein TESG_08284 [Trichophyton tonsurans CBS 112818]
MSVKSGKTFYTGTWYIDEGNKITIGHNCQAISSTVNLSSKYLLKLQEANIIMLKSESQSIRHSSSPNEGCPLLRWFYPVEVSIASTASLAGGICMYHPSGTEA